MTTLIVIIAAVLGQLCHIVKKRSEDGASEISTFRKWVVDRPFNTISASVMSVGAALGLQAAGSPPVDGVILGEYVIGNQPVSPDVIFFVQAFITGFAGNSLVNRPGK